MDRPKASDDYVIKAAADDLTTALMEWAEAGESERLGYRDDARDLMKEVGFHNGYWVGPFVGAQGIRA